MDADQSRKLRSRKPLSDLRNIDTRLSSQSSSSPTRTALKVKASKPKLSSALNKSIKSSTVHAPVNKVTAAPVDLSYAPPPSFSAPSTPAPSISSWVPGNGDIELWTSSVYSRRKTSDKSKTKGKAAQGPLIIMPMSEGKRENTGGNNLGRTSKATPKKKPRLMPAEQALPQDFVAKQRAYFNEVDLELLSVEEIESDAELE